MSTAIDADLKATAILNADEPTATPVSEAVAEVMKTKLLPIQQAIFELERLEDDREKWEKTELAASHTRLYSILHECYSYYLRMKDSQAPSETRQSLRDGLDSFIKSRGYKFNPNTHDMNRVVKAVFGAIDRRRVSAYSLALRAALIAGPANNKKAHTPLPTDQLIGWIQSKGGVEEIRLGSKNKGMTTIARASAAEHVVLSKKLMTIAVDEKVIPFDMDKTDKQVVLIATCRPTGEFDLHAVVKSDSAVNAVLAAYYSENKTEIEGAAKTAAIQSQEELKQQAINEAVAQA